MARDRCVNETFAHVLVALSAHMYVFRTSALLPEYAVIVRYSLPISRLANTDSDAQNALLHSKGDRGGSFGLGDIEYSCPPKTTKGASPGWVSTFGAVRASGHSVSISLNPV